MSSTCWLALSGGPGRAFWLLRAPPLPTPGPRTFCGNCIFGPGPGARHGSQLRCTDSNCVTTKSYSCSAKGDLMENGPRREAERQRLGSRAALGHLWNGRQGEEGASPNPCQRAPSSVIRAPNRVQGSRSFLCPHPAGERTRKGRLGAGADCPYSPLTEKHKIKRGGEIRTNNRGHKTRESGDCQGTWSKGASPSPALPKDRPTRANPSSVTWSVNAMRSSKGQDWFLNKRATNVRRQKYCLEPRDMEVGFRPTNLRRGGREG